MPQSSERGIPAPPSNSAQQPAWVDQLHCPACHERLALTRGETPPLGRGIWGSLCCSCSTYPVVDDIPILLHDTVGIHGTAGPELLADGPSIPGLLAMIAGPNPIVALERLLALSPVAWPFSRLPPVRSLLESPRAARVFDAWGRRTCRRMLRRRDEVTAEEWFAAAYLHGPRRHDNYSYFTYRLAQPRQLAFLALLETIPTGMVVDVGCGMGHLSWALTNNGRDVLGIDRNFIQLWVARWWIAPQADFVCADATAPLPLADEVADAALFADGIHYIPDAAALLSEMRRVAKNGTVFLPRFGNLDVLPNEAIERSVDQWRSILNEDGEYRLLDERSLRDAYLAGRAADLRRDAPDDVLAMTKWLFAATSRDPHLFVDHGQLPDPPPHARGRLAVNPIYIPVGGDGRRFRIALPSNWFAFEDGELFEYHAYQATLTDEQLQDLGGGQLTDSLRPLVDRFIVIGQPDQHLRTLRRRLKPRLETALPTVLPRLASVPDADTYPPSTR